MITHVVFYFGIIQGVPERSEPNIYGLFLDMQFLEPLSYQDSFYNVYYQGNLLS